MDDDRFFVNFSLIFVINFFTDFCNDADADADDDADADVDVDTDADNDAVTPSTNTWRYTRQSVTSSLGQSFLAGLVSLYLTLVVSE